MAIPHYKTRWLLLPFMAAGFLRPAKSFHRFKTLCALRQKQTSVRFMVPAFPRDNMHSDPGKVCETQHIFCKWSRCVYSVSTVWKCGKREFSADIA